MRRRSCNCPTTEQARELAECKTARIESGCRTPCPKPKSRSCKRHGSRTLATLPADPARAAGALRVRRRLGGFLGPLPARPGAEGRPGFPAGTVDKAADFDGETRADFGNVATSNATSRSRWRCGCAQAGCCEMPVLTKMADATSRRGFELYLDEAGADRRSAAGARIGFRLTHNGRRMRLTCRRVEHLP